MFDSETVAFAGESDASSMKVAFLHRSKEDYRWPDIETEPDLPEAL